MTGNTNRLRALKLAILRSLGTHPAVWKWSGYFVGLLGLVIGVTGVHLVLSGSWAVGLAALILFPIPLIGGYAVALTIGVVEEFEEAANNV